MNLANLYKTTRIILFDPSKGWMDILGKSKDRRKAILEYLFPMAMLVAICTFIGRLIIGDVNDSYSIMFIFINAIISFLIVFLEVYLSGWLIFELASILNTESDSNHIFNLVIYSHAPLFLSLAFIKIFPDLIFLSIIGLYSFYLYWIGMEKFAGVKSEKKGSFMLMSSIIMLLTFSLLTFVFNSFYDVIIDQFINFGTP